MLVAGFGNEFLVSTLRRCCQKDTPELFHVFHGFPLCAPKGVLYLVGFHVGLGECAPMSVWRSAVPELEINSFAVPKDN